MIVHGGDNGELGELGQPSVNVFDWTREELQTLDIGQGERMPTLEELLVICRAKPNMLINIELKAPVDQALAARYDIQLAA